MLRTLKAIIGIHHNSDATAAEIEGALAGARTEIEAAGRAHAEADAAYRAGLLRLDEVELQQIIADQQAAAVRRDRAMALAEALSDRLVAAHAAEDQAERRARYDAAARAQADAAKVLAIEYPKLARALVEVLRTVAAADALAQAANEVLPAGVERLSMVEDQVRREADAPGHVTAQEEFEAWCRPRGERLHPDDQGQVKPAPDGCTGTWKPVGGEPVPVVLRQFRRVTTTGAAPGRSIAALASTLNLPPLRPSHSAFWRSEAATSPAGILAVIEAEAPGWGKASGSRLAFEPTPTTEIIPLDAPAVAA